MCAKRKKKNFPFFPDGHLFDPLRDDIFARSPSHHFRSVFSSFQLFENFVVSLIRKMAIKRGTAVIDEFSSMIHAARPHNLREAAAVASELLYCWLGDLIVSFVRRCRCSGYLWRWVGTGRERDNSEEQCGGGPEGARGDRLAFAAFAGLDISKFNDGDV